MPGPGQRDSHPAGAAGHLEHGVAVLLRDALPERDVGFVVGLGPFVEPREVSIQECVLPLGHAVALLRSD